MAGAGRRGQQAGEGGGAAPGDRCRAPRSVPVRPRPGPTVSGRESATVLSRRRVGARLERAPGQPRLGPARRAARARSPAASGTCLADHHPRSRGAGGQPSALPRSGVVPRAHGVDLPRRRRRRAVRRALPLQRRGDRLGGRGADHPRRPLSRGEPVLRPPLAPPRGPPLPADPPVPLLRVRRRVRGEREPGSAAGRGRARALRGAGGLAGPAGEPREVADARRAVGLAGPAPRGRFGQHPPRRGQRREALEPRARPARSRRARGVSIPADAPEPRAARRAGGAVPEHLCPAGDLSGSGTAPRMGDGAPRALGAALLSRAGPASGPGGSRPSTSSVWVPS